MPSLPNILYILTDDQRAELLGCAGHPLLRTPHLDALAAAGTRFTQAHCTSPVCMASRACHYLGQWERRHGLNFNCEAVLDPQAWEQSFPMRLQAAGYQLGWVGKNHVPTGDDGYLEGVFDYWFGNHGHSGFYPKQQSRGHDYADAEPDTQVELFESAVHDFLQPTAGILPDHALRQRRDPDRPFCLCLTFNLPHAYGTGNMQLRPTDPGLYVTGYRESFREVPLPPTYRSWDRAEPRLPLDVYDNMRLTSYDYVRSPIALRERRIREYQTVTGIDAAIGRIREALDDLGLADNTIIVFSTDHGIHHGEHGLGGKCFLYKEDLNIPLIVYDPRLPATNGGQVRDDFVLVPDLAPTMLDLAGTDIPDTMQGRSLTPLLRGDNPQWRDQFATEQLMDIQNYPRSESLRSREWVYIRYFKRTEDPAQADLMFRGTLDDYRTCLRSTLTGEAPIYEELFDLTADPHETTNVATAPANAERLANMRAALDSELTAALPAGAPLTIPR
jgi:arylsulfatase A-like enzyme